MGADEAINTEKDVSKSRPILSMVGVAAGTDKTATSTVSTAPCTGRRVIRHKTSQQIDPSHPTKHTKEQPRNPVLPQHYHPVTTNKLRDDVNDTE